MSRVQIAVLNKSTVLTDAQITPMVTAGQIQVTRDFAPIFGTDAQLIQVMQGQQPPAGAWWIGFFDDSDQAGALGYHDLSPEGLPFAKIFAKTDQQYGLNSSVTFSHELIEMLGDAGCDLTAQMSDNSFTAYELCDAVEDDSLGYPIVLPDGSAVKMSDFVYPAFFMTNPPTGAKFDKCGHVSAPFQITTGGYMSIWTAGSGWSQQTGGKDKRRHPVGSRMEKRMNKGSWKVSQSAPAQ